MWNFIKKSHLRSIMFKFNLFNSREWNWSHEYKVIAPHNFKLWQVTLRASPVVLDPHLHMHFFHPWCRCRSMNVAKWSMLTVNSDEKLSMNWRPPCITPIYAGSLLSAKGQRTLLMEQLSLINNWLRFRGSKKLWNTYPWTGWVSEITSWG